VLVLLATDPSAWEEIADVRTHSWSNRLYTAEFFGAEVVLSTGESSKPWASSMRLGSCTSCARRVRTASRSQSWGLRCSPSTSANDSRPGEVQGGGRRGPGRLRGRRCRRSPTDIATGGFDVVYTGGGVLVWVPDISRWAAVVAGALRLGGRFVLWEYHPVASAFAADAVEVRLARDYLGGPGPTETRGWTHFAAGRDAQTPKYEFHWTLGEIVTALADAGLCVTALGEYPSEADWQFGEAIEAARRLPGQLSCRATPLTGYLRRRMLGASAARFTASDPWSTTLSRRSRRADTR